MKRLLPVILAICLLLSGCGWLDGTYANVTPHHQQSVESDTQLEVAENYLQLRTALENMVAAGVESRVISVTNFRTEQLEDSVAMAVRYVKDSYPIGAYAVEEIHYEVGTVGGVSAVAVEISYFHEKYEIQRIRQVADMEAAREIIHNALKEYQSGVVLHIDSYLSTDIQQMVEDYAAANPSIIMEIPEVGFQLYPETGRERVLELKFTYQSSRDTLRAMREVVRRFFDSAALYVSHDARDTQKISQLYSFLMERFDSYQIKTSITPAYSLLSHGVGDSAAFAEVYAEMCRRAGVECLVVVGTRSGEPWCWNIVQDEGYYYHVDLLACQARGGFRYQTDDQMTNYVWDYSAYPGCTGRPAEEATVEREGEDIPDGTTPPSGK
jgi:hypothetical protein